MEAIKRKPRSRTKLCELSFTTRAQPLLVRAIQPKDKKKPDLKTQLLNNVKYPDPAINIDHDGEGCSTLSLTGGVRIPLSVEILVVRDGRLCRVVCKFC
jgi:hypothetical protein